MTRRLTLLLPILLAIVTFTGCRSQRGASSTGTYTADSKDPVAAIAASYADWSTVNVPVTLSLSSPTQISLSGRARMTRGQNIDLSLRMIGFEVARVWITPDSIIAVSRPKRVYLAESLSTLTSRIPVTLGNLQDLLTGRPFIPGGSTLTPGSDTRLFMVDTRTDDPLLTPRKSLDGVDFRYRLMLPAVVSALLIDAPVADMSLEANYSDPISPTPAGTVMSEVQLAAEIPGKSIKASFDWRWNQAVWGEMYPLTAPSTAGLNRIDVRSLSKMLKTL